MLQINNSNNNDNSNNNNASKWKGERGEDRTQILSVAWGTHVNHKMVHKS